MPPRGQCFERRVGAGAFVLVDHGRTLISRNLDGHRLRLEPARRHRGHGLVMTRECERVLVRARHACLLRSVLSQVSHVGVREGVPQAVVDHAVHELAIARLDPAPHAVNVVRRVGHRLHSAGDHALLVAGLDRLSGEHYGLEARAANLVDGDRGDCAGQPSTIPSVTINKVCGSGLKAVMLAAQAIKAGDEQCVVAGGMESMSNAPHYVYGMRGGIKAGNTQLVDGMINDGLWDSFSNTHMGSLAEYTAKKAHVSREDQDRFALASHQKAVAAMEACRFKAETIPVEIPGKKGPTLVEKDEGPRADTTLEALAALKPSFEKDGTVTAGNAPGLNDGASALVVASLAFARARGLTPLARITG